ncbi:MAG: phosphoglycolate phosphatase [Burkholderiales bacterium]
MDSSLWLRPALGFPLTVAAIAFDLDGTLADTLPDLHESANRMLGDVGYPSVPQEKVRRYIGNGVDRLVKRLLHDVLSGEPPDELFNVAAARFSHHYAEMYSRASNPYPGVLDTLATMRRRGLLLACVTNKPMRFTAPLLADLSLTPCLDLVLAGDSLARKKPDPLPLLHAAEQFGVPPARLLMVGDSPADTGAARAAGCPVFCVPYGYRGSLDVRDLDCDAIVPALQDILNLIQLPSDGLSET